jgi:hypothetical protein
MALPLPPGLTPMEVAFLCEMEMVTVIPRQKLESLSLLGVRSSPPTPRSFFQLCLHSTDKSRHRALPTLSARHIGLHFRSGLLSS